MESYQKMSKKPIALGLTIKTSNRKMSDLPFSEGEISGKIPRGVYIDSGFNQNLKLNRREPGPATALVDIYSLSDEVFISDMFTNMDYNLSSLVMSQGQIISFFNLNYDWLSGKRPNLFLTKGVYNYVVINVFWRQDRFIAEKLRFASSKIFDKIKPQVIIPES